MMRVRHINVFLLLVFFATAITVTADIEVPDPIGGVGPIGSGSGGDPLTYNYSSSALDLGADNIINTNHSGNGNVVLTGITTLSYGSGGSFDFSCVATSYQAHAFLRIYASSNVNVRSIDTRALTSGNFEGGHVVIEAGQDITADYIVTMGMNRNSGNATLVAGDTVTIVSNLTTEGKGGGHLNVTASSIIGDGFNARATSNNRNAGDLNLTATNGSIVVAGDILSDSGQGYGGPVALNASGDIIVGGTVDVDGKRYSAGSVTMMAGGNITVTGAVTAAMPLDPVASPEDGGPITITAGGAISLTDVDSHTIGINVTDDAGNIAITSTTANVTITGVINAHSDTGINGHLNISAPDGIITIGDLDVDNFNVITFDAGRQGLIVTGRIDGLIVGSGTVKGGFKTDSLSGDILYSEDANTHYPLAGNYRILDKDTDADTGYMLVNKFPVSTVIIVK